MTSKQRHDNDQSTSMARADVANGEGPDNDSQSDKPTPQPGFGDHGSHPTGTRQAEANKENDPPA